MLRFRRCRDGHHRLAGRNSLRRLQYGRSAERMTDENGGRLQLALHELGGGDQVVDVRREGGVREVALALAQPGEIEAQHANPRLGQRPADVHHRLVVLRAGEAVGE